MFYQQCYTNPRLNKLIYGCCNAAARTSSLLVAELVLPQASNCNTSSRGEGGGGGGHPELQQERILQPALSS